VRKWPWIGLGAVLVSAPAQAAPPPPERGVYRCYILTTIAGPDGIPAVVPSPSVLGRLTLASGGRYRLRSGGGGRWSHRRGRVRFRGGLLGRLRVAYRVEEGKFRFVVRYRSQQHFCDRASARAIGPGRPASRYTGSVLVSNAGLSTGNLGDISAIAVRTGRRTVRVAGAEPGVNAAGLLAYTDSGFDIAVVAPDGRRLAFFDEGRLDSNTRYYPAVSPDGGRVAYTTGNPGGISEPFQRVVVRALDGSELASYPGLSQPAWAPDGRLVMAGSAAVFDSHGLEGLYVAAVGAAPARIDPSLPGVEQPSVSPRGDRIAFVSGDALWTIGLDGAGPVRLLAGTGPVAFPAWSPKADALALLRGDAEDEVAILALGGRRRLQALTDGGGDAVTSVGRIAWAP
jgi:Tol biopolymer transport system component